MSKGQFKGTENTRLFRVTADKRVPGLGLDRSTNFVVDVGQTIQRVERMSITSVTFPNVFYNIIGYDTSYSYTAENVIYANMGGNILTTTIPAGYYSVGTLMNQISAQLNPLIQALEATDTIAFTFDPITNKVSGTFTSAGSYNQLTFLLPTSTQLATAGLPSAMNMTSNPMTKLGFVFSGSGGISLVFPTTVAKVATNLPSLLGLTKCYIRSQKLAASNSVDEKGTISSIMLPVVISAPFGGLNVFECKVDHLCEIIFSKPVDFNQLDIQLVDRSGNEVNLNGANLQIEFKIWFNNF